MTAELDIPPEAFRQAEDALRGGDYPLPANCCEQAADDAVRAAAPYLIAAELQWQANVLDANAAEFESLTDADRAAYRGLADILRDRAYEAVQS